MVVDIFWFGINIVIDDGATLHFELCMVPGNNIPDGPKQVADFPNGFGLYDMHGNVQEMVNDWATTSSPNFTPHVSKQRTLYNGLLVDQSPGGTIKVLRGGSLSLDCIIGL